jgi:hypothetical protein
METTVTIVGREALKRRAEEILTIMSHLQGVHGLREAISVVEERFIDGEPEPELKRLAEVMALARRQALLQQLLDVDREALHHGHLSHEEHVSTGHHYEMLRHQACTYNHLLRGLIEVGSQYFSREELMSWLTSASLGRAMWAKGEITGAVSEIALHAALQGMPEIRKLRYGSVEEDLMGYDFVGEWEGRLLTIDAKTGFYPALSEIKRGHRHLEIAVPREIVKDLRINHRGLASVRQEIHLALTGKTESEYHAPDQNFQPA